MKKLIFLVTLILLSTSVYAACFDDDGGINYKQKGICKDTVDTYEGIDSCRGGGLVEYYCHDSLCKAQLKQCSNCVDGVCLSSEADTVIEANRPPEVELYILATPGKTEAAFKAVVDDPDNEMVLFTIEFGDGAKSSNKPDVIHDYGTNGTFNVKITARDASGAATVYEKEVEITKEAEIIEAPVKKEEPKEEKVGFFKGIINWFKGLFS